MKSFKRILKCFTFSEFFPLICNIKALSPLTQKVIRGFKIELEKWVQIKYVYVVVKNNIKGELIQANIGSPVGQIC